MRVVRAGPGTSEDLRLDLCDLTKTQTFEWLGAQAKEDIGSKRAFRVLSGAELRRFHIG